MNENCLPYPRMRLYWIMTAPMLLLYGGVAFILAGFGRGVLMIYLLLFLVVALGQSTACVEFQCPYVGHFSPCAAGFCLPASWIARLYFHKTLPRWLFPIGITAAEIAFFGVILFPLYFLYQLSIFFLLGYILIALGYAAGYLHWICPECAIREDCPGGQASTALFQIKEKTKG